MNTFAVMKQTEYDEVRYIILWQNEHEEGSLSCKFLNPDEGNVN